MRQIGKRITGVLLALVIMLGTFTSVTMTAEAAGNSLSEATSINLGSTYYGEITSSNKNDYYKFTLSKSGSINFTYSGPTGGIYLSLYNADNSEIEDHPISYTTYTFDLTSGTYYLRFRYSYSSGEYNFKMTFTSANESFSETQGGSNNTTATASNISTGKTYYGQIAQNDKIDYYKFTLTQSGSINFTYSGPTGGIYLSLYNSSNSQLRDHPISYTSYTFELTAGTYYLKFRHSYSYGAYSFMLTLPDNTNPTGSISSTNSVATSQTATLYLYDNVGVAGYYWGTSSSYSSNSYSSVSSAPTSTSVTKTISSSGTYYLTVKDTAGNISTTYSVTYYKTTLNANGGSVSPSYVITKSGSSFTFPTPTKSGYECKGWSTSSTATSGSNSLSPSGNSTYYAVWKVPVVLSSISIYSLPNKTTYYIGDTLNTTGLKIKLTYSDNSTETVSSGFTTNGFSSSSTGTKTITVSYSGKTTTFNVTVNLPTVSLSSTSKSLTLGDTATLTATTTPSGQTVTWTSSDTNVATVSNGTITAKAVGTVTITAKITYNSNTYSKTCSVVVSKALSSVSVSSNPDKTVYFIGDTLDTTGLKLNLIYNDSSTETISSGFITSGFSSDSVGIKTITVSYGDKSTTLDVTVKTPTISISSISESITEDDTLTLTTTTTPGEQNVTWVSSDVNVASVSNGVVTAKATGTATVTAKFTYNGIVYSKTCEITVLSKVTLIRGDVNGDNLVTSDDAIQVLYYTLLPEMYTVNQDSDFNGDGMVTSDDAIYLLYYTLLPELYPLQ